jgi:hypothetical protein
MTAFWDIAHWSSPWWWRQYEPLTRGCASTRLHGAISQKLTSSYSPPLTTWNLTRFYIVIPNIPRCPKRPLLFTYSTQDFVRISYIAPTNSRPLHPHRLYLWRTTNKLEISLCNLLYSLVTSSHTYRLLTCTFLLIFLSYFSHFPLKN